MLHHLSNREKIIIMLAVMSGLFLAALDQTIVSTALPKILHEFNALKELSWVVTAYLLTSTIAVPIAGKMSDLYGRRIVLLIGVATFGVASLLCGTATDINQMIAYRALQGIGGGVLFAGAFTVIGDLFSPRERGKWQGIFGAIFGLSSLIGPLLGGFLTDGNNLFGITTNWRWAFFINIPVAIAAFALVARFLPTIITRKDEIVDYLGAVLLSVALGSLVLATSLGGTEGWAWSSLQIIGLFALTVASTVGFLWAERRAVDPIIPLKLFKSSIFSLICIMMLLFGMGFLGAVIFIPTYAQQVLNFSATNSGIIMLPMVIGLTISSVITGRIINKTGKYKIWIVAGLAVSTLGVLSLSTLGIDSTYTDLALRMLLTGLGMGIAMPIFTTTAQNAVEQKDLGVASSSVQLARSIGGTVGIAVLGGVMNNTLSQKLAGIQSEPFVQFAASQGKGDQFQNFDINSIQGFLAPDTQGQIAGQLGQLPPSMQQQALDSLHHLVATLQTALTSSITQMFLISAVVMAVAFIVSFWVKEIPLRHHGDDKAPVDSI